MSLRRNLQIVWDETTSPMAAGRGDVTRRYVARAFSSAGTGWGVYDMKGKKFLKDSEVKRLTVDDIRAPLVLS